MHRYIDILNGLSINKVDVCVVNQDESGSWKIIHSFSRWGGGGARKIISSFFEGILPTLFQDPGCVPHMINIMCKSVCLQECVTTILANCCKVGLLYALYSHWG